MPITVFVVGIMNAFNMMDGINGLWVRNDYFNANWFFRLIYDSMLVLIIGSMIGFVIFNLGIFGKQNGVFLGDSGSNLVGFGWHGLRFMHHKAVTVLSYYNFMVCSNTAFRLY